MDAVLRMAVPFSGVERYAGFEAVSEFVAQGSQAAPASRLPASCCFDLERQYGTVGLFHDQVDFKASSGSPVPDCGCVVHPRHLLENLTYGERLEQMTELLQGRPVPSR